jgi:hypothetical protein
MPVTINTVQLGEVRTSEYKRAVRFYRRTSGISWVFTEVVILKLSAAIIDEGDVGEYPETVLFHNAAL